MGSPDRANATILAHHLYDFAECEHRIALDATLDRSQRTPPDAAMEMLFEHGRRLERRIVEPLGYPAVDVQNGNFKTAFERTRALMREGVAGIDQGVLIDGTRLARPDLLERASGPSALGEFHYVPGDVKSARIPRSDAVLQVAFAALLLEAVQGVRPARGFVVLGDGRREEIDLEAIRCTVDDAVERAEAVARGAAASSPYYSAACGRCRWRGHCLPELERARDLSFVHGMTRARRRVLMRHGVSTIDDLAVADTAALVALGVPTEGLDRMRDQARTLLAGRESSRGPARMPRGAGRERFLRIEIDPIERGEPFLIAFGEGRIGAAIDTERIAVMSTVEERRAALTGLLEVLQEPTSRAEPIFTFGAGTASAFEALTEACAIDPARAGDVAGRFVDLAPWVRRAAVLPVLAYRFDEVAAVARRLPRPGALDRDDALFVLHAGLAGARDPETVRARLQDAGHDALVSLQAIRRWIAS
jgi:predicted RecB family nuclease